MPARGQTDNIMRKLLSLLLLALVVAGCDNKKSAEELFKETASGVVVVLNEFYYELKLPNGKSLYFTGLDEEGDIDGLTADIEDAIKNRNIITGTAFFVGTDGTNNCSFVDYYGFMHVDQNRLAQLNMQQAELSRQFNELSASREGIDDNIDPEGIKITPVCRLGIAYNDTYVTSVNDFTEKNPCVVVRTSDKEDVDLALLQLKNKKTPEGAYVFKMYGEDDSKGGINRLFADKSNDGRLKIDQQLYMIGYNAGLVLANTKQGIKVQMTSGKVTQLPDGQRLLYSIPTLQGSSGSPVIDEYGNLVAVNFAKLGTTDNFNFGIPAERIKEFIGK